ncbi:hypothetical protein [Planktotalea arctica]|uniref:hypothetical protein n=1 Tax=Planktotalea arctica TaxID=1481893 RepID=UPI001C38AF92|nr:hypothetical protein [Planktotalea arctica]
MKGEKHAAHVLLFLAGAFLASYLAWWRTSGYHISLSTIESLRIVTLTGVAYLMLCWPYKNWSANSETVQTHRAMGRTEWSLLAVFVALACAFVPYKGLILDDTLLTTWHHWAAYIGPAELMREGVYPLHDIPAQYGFGPTSLIALSCGVLDCWSGFYWLNVVFTIAFFTALAYATLILSRQSSLPASVALLICISICAFGWTMYPPSLLSPVATPSTSGMRFLPATLMMCFLVHTALCKPNDPTVRSIRIPGHLFWIFGLLWSPEAAVHTTFMWGPFFVWSSVFYGPHPRSARVFFNQVALLVAILLATLTGFVFVFWLLSGEVPLWRMYTASLRNPPGALPVDYMASIWFALGCFGLWFIALWAMRNEEATDGSALASWIAMLFAIVTFTYFLGRSHSNNILNLLPYFAILLVAIRTMQTAWAVQQLAAVLLAALIGWSGIFGWGYYQNARDTAGYFAHQGTALTTLMSYQNPDNVAQFMKLQSLEAEEILEQQQNDLREALDYIRDVRGEPAEIFDAHMLIEAQSGFGPWSGIHPVSTAYFATSQERQQYLRNALARLDRAGWIVISDTFALTSIVDDYATVYEQTEKLVFGTYAAIRYSPTLDPVVQ